MTNAPIGDRKYCVCLSKQKEFSVGAVFEILGSVGAFHQVQLLYIDKRHPKKFENELEWVLGLEKKSSGFLLKKTLVLSYINHIDEYTKIFENEYKKLKVYKTLLRIVKFIDYKLHKLNSYYFPKFESEIERLKSIKVYKFDYKEMEFSEYLNDDIVICVGASFHFWQEHADINKLDMQVYNHIGQNNIINQSIKLLSLHQSLNFKAIVCQITDKNSNVVKIKSELNGRECHKIGKYSCDNAHLLTLYNINRNYISLKDYNNVMICKNNTRLSP